jgi:phosphonate transport system substrate-binding protein
MTGNRNLSVGSLVAACLALLLCLCGTPARAEGCNVPYLAPGFCDRNGAMVADPPEDKSKWLDPDPIVLADVPTSDMTNRSTEIAPFLRHLEKALGRKVIVFAARDYPDLLAAFRSGQVHVLNINAGSVETAVRCYGFVPVAQPIDTSGKIAGYRMEMIVPAGSPIKQASDLRGHKIAFVDENSNSGYKIPRTILKQEFGLEAGRDYTSEFSGRHDNSVMGVANNIYEAAPVASSEREKLTASGMVDASTFRIIYTSKTFPQSPFGIDHRLNPALAARIRDAFVQYNGAMVFGSGSRDRFRPASYKTDWAFMREMSAASGQPQTCR